MTNLSAFKAYDVRGRIPTEINEELVRDIGRAYAAFVRPKRVVVGRDIRLTSATLASALIDGLRSCGVDVYDIGLCGTEGVYFATSLGDEAGAFDGGIMVTASHNPPDYNGLKFVREGSRPISADTGLKEMAALIRDGKVHQIYSLMQSGKKFGMQTMNDALYQLYVNRLVSADDCVRSSGDPNEFLRMIGKGPMDDGFSARPANGIGGRAGDRPLTGGLRR